jgi:outer membrane protein TolC
MLARIFLTIVLLGTVVPPLLGSERLSLREAMSRARVEAREVAAAHSRIEASDARLREARGHRRPSISLEEIWMRTDSPAEVFALQLNQERFSFAEFVVSDPNDPDTIQNATTRLQISLPLYTGGELSSRIRQAGLAADAARNDAIWTGERAALAAAEAYILLIQARENVQLLTRSLESIEAHAARARAYTEQGMLVRSELLLAEVEESRVADLLTAARGDTRVATSNLAFRLGVEQSTEWELEALSDPPPLGQPLESWLDAADSRQDLEAARRKLEAGELEIKVKRSQLFPKVGLVARHDLVDDSLFGSHGDSSAVVAVGRLDLWGGGRHRAATAAARAEVEAASWEVEHLAEAIRLEVRKAYELATSARDRHSTAQAAQEAAREAERITRERFDQGVAKMIDLLDATTARREAETRELVARADAHLASLQLAVKAGNQPESVLPPDALSKPEATLPTPPISED